MPNAAGKNHGVVRSRCTCRELAATIAIPTATTIDTAATMCPSAAQIGPMRVRSVFVPVTSVSDISSASAMKPAGSHSTGASVTTAAASAALTSAAPDEKEYQ